METRKALSDADTLPRYFPQVFRAAQKMSRGRLTFVLPDNGRFVAAGAAPGPEAELIVNDPDIFARLVREGDLGFCEAYMDGAWDSPDLMAFMLLVHSGNEELYDGFPGQGLVRAYERFRHWLRDNSRAQARRNIAHHYDLGNDFYALWLDETMSYSSARFTAPDQPLAEAQRAKYAALVDGLGVKPGDHVLEIGCGWGGFAEYAAAERGLRVTGITISRAQLDYAQARIQAAGLADRVDLRLQDYRDVQGRFDAIASIEMFEAVGEAYWPSYFDTLSRCLAPGARAGLQVITVDDARFESYRKNVDFIRKYIFPGGMLAAPGVLATRAGAAGLHTVETQHFGRDYARTLVHWHDNFRAAWPQIEALGFDARFRRMWNLYLASCFGAFESGHCDVIQTFLERR
nr:cyclopropane-fatty-acyl-phospholipid synthase family protein [Phaeovulum vinaykumarii]